MRPVVLPSSSHLVWIRLNSSSGLFLSARLRNNFPPASMVPGAPCMRKWIESPGPDPASSTSTEGRRVAVAATVDLTGSCRPMRRRYVASMGGRVDRFSAFALHPASAAGGTVPLQPSSSSRLGGFDSSSRENRAQDGRDGAEEHQPERRPIASASHVRPVARLPEQSWVGYPLTRLSASTCSGHSSKGINRHLAGRRFGGIQ